MAELCSTPPMRGLNDDYSMIGRVIVNKKLISRCVVVLLVLFLMPVTEVWAWGPERETYTMEEPADYATFNSITNNPTLGDERDFVRVGEINPDKTTLGNEVEVVPGKQYTVYIYYHNNASTTFNDSAHDNVGIAVRTRMASSFSTVITPDEKGVITATITADNTDPESVWDEAYMTTVSGKVLLHYVEGSAKIYNGWDTNGSVLPSSLFTEEGTLLGCDELNGAIPGCEEYHGSVSYVLQAEELAGTVEATVSKDGKEYSKSVVIGPGDEVYYKLTIKNAGDVELSNATVIDSLPDGLTLVSGSVELWANGSSTKNSLSDNLTSGGYNLGTIGAGNTVFITYRVKVAKNIGDEILDLTNHAKFVYDSDVAVGDSDEDSAIVTVDRNGSSRGSILAGPLTITFAIIIVFGIGGSFGYFISKRKNK